MAWFAFDENSARSLQKSREIRKTGVKMREGNALTEALAAQESILLLPGTVAESPFLLHIQNRRNVESNAFAKKWWKFW